LPNRGLKELNNLPPSDEELRRTPGTKDGFIKGWLKGQSVPRLVLLGVAGYLVLALTAYALFAGNACAVMVDGKTIAVADSEKIAKKALAEVVKQKSDQVGGPVTVGEKLTYRGINAQPEEIMGQDTLQKKFSEALTFNTSCTAIVINDEAGLYLKNEEAAQELLSWLIAYYPVLEGEQPAFKENVELVKTNMPVDYVQDLEPAKQKALLGAEQIQQYVVKDGDTIWDVARALGIDMEQIAQANPGIKLDELSIGQTLKLKKAAPLLTVVATRLETVREEIPYQVEVKKDDSLLFGEKKIITPGESGEREVTYLVIRENGLETDRQVLEAKVAREVKNEVVAMGSVTLLASRGGGSARLDWPAAGIVTSHYGMRWGSMHKGIDIGAGYGSNVTAAAGGTVIAAGWDGGYGMAVDISHGGGLITKYAHLSSIGVSPGQSVGRGEVIGQVGSTGNSTGPHLHFEVIIGGQTYNPLDYLP
jgi:murein DD-endopeptidase MepM/ murein hydrolase activator NlpD